MRYISLFIIPLLCIISTNVQASHHFGAHIGWKSVGKDSFEIEVNTYRDCSSRALNTLSVTASSNCGYKKLVRRSVTTTKFIPDCAKTPSCTSKATGKNLGVEKAVSYYLVVVDDWRKNGCCEFNVNVTARARNASITTIAKDTARAFHTARINLCQNASGINSWSQAGAFSAPLGRDFIKRIQLSTNDTTDSIVYSLVTPTTVSGNVAYSSPYSNRSPLYFLAFPKATRSKPAGFHLNATTGRLQFRPMKAEVALIAIRANVFRAGKLIGYSTNEFTVYVPKIPSSGSPKLTGINGSVIDSNFSFCNNWKNCVYIVGYSHSITDEVLLSYSSNLPPDATITHKGYGTHRDTLQICWTPDTTKYPANGYYLKVNAQYDLCPSIDSSSKTYYFNVSTPAKIYPSITVNRLNCDSFIIECDSAKSTPIHWSINGRDTSTTNRAFTLHAQKRGLYKIKAVLDNCNLEEAYDTVDVLDLNDTEVQLTTSTARCTGDTVLIESNVLKAGSNLNYIWHYNTMDAKLASPLGKNVNLVYQSGGKKNVKLTVIDKSIDTLGCRSGAWVNLWARVVEQKNIFNKLHCDGDAFPSPTALPLYENTSGWKGAGIKNDVFDFKELPGYGHYKLDYRFMHGDTGACVHYKAEVRFYKSPSVSVNEKQFKICKSGSGRTISAKPSGGYWYGVGMSGQDFFSPGQVKVGKHPLVYTFTDTMSGCKSSDTTFVEVINRKPEIEIPASITLCGNAQSVIIDGKPLGGHWTSEQFKTQGSSIEIDPSKVSRAGAYSITYRVEDSLQCVNIEGTTVHIKTFTKAKFYLEENEMSPGDTAKVVNTSTIRNNTLFKWTAGTPIVASSNALNPILTISDTGYFDIKLVATDLVSSCVDSFKIKDAIYVKEPEVKSIEEIENRIIIAPNPVTDILFIYGGANEKYLCQLLDLNGRVLLETKELSHGDGMHLKGIDNGTYILNLSTSEGSIQRKIIVSH